MRASHAHFSQLNSYEALVAFYFFLISSHTFLRAQEFVRAPWTQILWKI